MKKSFLETTLAFLLVLTTSQAWSQYGFDRRTADSLELRMLMLPESDTARIPLLVDLSKAYLYQDARKCIEFAQKGIDLAKAKDIPTDPRLFLFQGRGYARIPDNEKAESLLNLALKTAQDQNDTVNEGWIYISMGFYQYNLRNVPAALDYFNKSLRIGETLGDMSIQAESWFGIGVSYYIYDDLENMYLSMQSYLAVAETAKDKRRIADAYRMIGLYYRHTGEILKAIDANQQSYDLALSINDSSMMGAALNHIAFYYYELGQLEKSLEVYKKNISLYPNGQPNYMANIYGNVGNIYRDWERYPEAIEYYNKSIELSLKVKDMFNLSWLYKDISQMYERTGDYKKAYEHMQLAALYQDSLASVTYQQQLAGARAQYEAEKNAKDLELLSVKYQRNQILTWGLIAGIGLIVVVAVLIITRSRFKAHKRISDMEIRISELNQTNLRQQMNPHFIFNTLNSIQYYVFQNDRIASNNYMTKFASLIRKTLENSQHTAITFKEELDTLHLYLELECLRFKEKFEWEIKVDEEIDTLAYKIPTMLIQPYVENAITHGLMHKENGKGHIQVDLQLQDHQILCTIEDNGIGRAKAREIKQQKSGNHQSMGLTITESRLKLVNDLYGNSMKVVYTDLGDERGNPAGTRVQINIPIIT
jgi:tetratricopeptide (TPR) repeat protein